MSATAVLGFGEIVRLAIAGFQTYRQTKGEAGLSDELTAAIDGAAPHLQTIQALLDSPMFDEIAKQQIHAALLEVRKQMAKEIEDSDWEADIDEQISAWEKVLEDKQSEGGN